MSTRTPRMRFPEFSHAGEWEEKELSKVADVIAGQSPNGENYNSIGIGVAFYQGKSDFGEIYLNPPTKWTSEVTKLAEHGDILISVRAPVGALNITKEKVCIGRGLAAIQVKEDKWFMFYYLLSIQPKIIGNGGSIFDSINKDQIEKLVIQIPSLAEQQKIADCLSSLDELITAHTRKLEALKVHKRGLMQQLFPQAGKTVPRLRFPEFADAGEWEEKKLGELLMYAPEYGLNAPAVPYSDQLPTYLRITDISEEGKFISENRVSVKAEVMEYSYLADGDIALARTGASVGKSYKYDVNDGLLVFAGYLIRLKPDPQKGNSDFISQYLLTNSYWEWIKANSERSGQPGINATQYSDMPLLVPSNKDERGLSEQQHLGKLLSSLDALINYQRKKIKTHMDHKQGLIQQLFPLTNRDLL